MVHYRSSGGAIFSHSFLFHFLREERGHAIARERHGKAQQFNSTVSTCVEPIRLDIRITRGITNTDLRAFNGWEW